MIKVANISFMVDVDAEPKEYLTIAVLAENTSQVDVIEHKLQQLMNGRAQVCVDVITNIDTDVGGE